MHCYGHGRPDDKATCTSCELASHCHDARDIPLSGHFQMDDGCTTESHPAPEPRMFDVDALEYLVEAAIASPQSFKVFISALRQPSASLKQLATANGMSSKQHAHYYILKFARLANLPENIVKSLLCRNNGQRVSAAYREPPAWLRHRAA